jgi:hypothetical protein
MKSVFKIKEWLFYENFKSMELGLMLRGKQHLGYCEKIQDQWQLCGHK